MHINFFIGARLKHGFVSPNKRLGTRWAAWFGLCDGVCRQNFGADVVMRKPSCVLSLYCRDVTAQKPFCAVFFLHWGALAQNKRWRWDVSKACFNLHLTKDIYKCIFQLLTPTFFLNIQLWIGSKVIVDV